MGKLGVIETKNASTRGPFYCPDPIGHRTGYAPSPDAAATIVRTCDDADEAVSKVSCLVFFINEILSK